MNNLVIGASGFVGRYLCQYLKNLGENVIEYDIVRSKNEDCRYYKLPLNNIDRVYFLAWKVGGANYLYDPDTQKEQLDWNISILTNSMDQLKGIPFVFVSTQLAEKCDNVYSLLKRLGEVWTEMNGGVSVRFWNVYGAYENSSVKSHVVADFVHQALDSGKIIMQTTGQEHRQFVHADDICNSLYLSFGNKGIYDSSSLQWSSVLDVANLISKYTGCEVIVGNKIGSTFWCDNRPLVPDCTPNVSLEDGIKKTIELFKKVKYEK